MLIVIPQVLSGASLQQAQALLRDAPWDDGRVTAGDQSAQVKNNSQLPQEHAVTAALRQVVLEGLSRSLIFFSANFSFSCAYQCIFFLFLLLFEVLF